MHDIDQLFRQTLVEEPSEHTWQQAVDYVRTALESWMGAPVFFAEPPDLGDGFSAEFVIETGPIHWQGILGCDLLEGQPPWISAVLFPFICQHRVMPGNGSDYVYFRFVVEAGAGQWQEQGWKPDEFGEYEYFQTYRRGS